MEMCYEGALVMPKNYVVMNEEEMTYVEGGVGVGAALALLTAWGTTVWACGREAGIWTYNSGYTIHGTVYRNFCTAATIVWGILGLPIFKMRFDNGYYAAQKGIA